MIITIGDAIKNFIKTLDFENQRPIIHTVKTKKGCKMNKEKIINEYAQQGYSYVGCVNYNQKAFNAYRESNKHQAIQIGNCLELVLLHDTKQIVEIDFGD